MRVGKPVEGLVVEWNEEEKEWVCK